MASSSASQDAARPRVPCQRTQQDRARHGRFHHTPRPPARPAPVPLDFSIDAANYVIKPTVPCHYQRQTLTDLDLPGGPPLGFSAASRSPPSTSSRRSAGCCAPPTQALPRSSTSSSNALTERAPRQAEACSEVLPDAGYCTRRASRSVCIRCLV